MRTAELTALTTFHETLSGITFLISNARFALSTFEIVATRANVIPDKVYGKLRTVRIDQAGEVPRKGLNIGLILALQ